MIVEDNSFNKNGFTLIELMVVVAVLSLIIIGTVSFFSGGIRSWISGQYQLKAQREARMRLDQMVKEIREGDKFDSASGENTIIVEYNILSKDNVTYSWSGTSGDSITRKSGSGTPAPFLDNVHDFSVTYLNQSGIIMTDESNASKILIDLQLDLDGDAASGGNPDIDLNTEVNLRNYGLGIDEDAGEEEG
jgi:prepilin-type N-terminal cleavage/methylation domain-containing protein